MFDESVLSGDYDHYYSQDPAFDSECDAFDHERWIETRDAAALPRKNGTIPVLFKLRRLGSKAKRYLLDQQQKHGINSMAWWAVALSLSEVEGPDAKVERVNDAGWMRLSDDWMDKIERVDDGALFWELVTRVQREVFGSPRD